MKLIVGLGNPGKKYAKTRHNAGWIALDILIEKYGYEQVKFDDDIHLFITHVHGEKIVFAKPQTFMNNSGCPIRRIMQFYKIPLQDILIIHDEKDFPIGKCQLKIGGSSAGHNGIKSVINELGTPDFFRCRVGINQPLQHWTIIDWVLSNLKNDEIKNISTAFNKLVDCVNWWAKGAKPKEMALHFNNF